MVKTLIHPGQMQLPLSDLDNDWRTPWELPDLHGAQVWDLETRDPFLMSLGPGWAYKDRKKYGHIVGFAVAADNLPEGTYIPIRHEGGGNVHHDIGTVKRWAQDQLKKPGPKIFANASYDVGWFEAEDIHVNPLDIEDVQIMEPLLDEYRLSYSLEQLSLHYLGVPKDEDLLLRALRAHGYKDKGDLHKLHAKHVGIYGGGDAKLTMGVWRKQRAKITEENLDRIYQLERHLVKVVVAMRMKGVRVDNDRIDQLERDWEREIEECKRTVGRNTGVSVTAWDTKHLGDALQEEGIKLEYTSQGNPSITAEWLYELGQQPGVSDKTKQTLHAIRRLRVLDKAASAFLNNAWRKHQVDGRVHVQWNQLRTDEGGTVSGRFSCSKFNMQQQPARDEEIGPAVRSVAIAEEGEKWLAADYSSQEPRLTVHWAVKTHWAGQPGFSSAITAQDKYKNDPETDYHQMVADICGIARKQAKPINLGLAYGMGGPKLCRSLGLPTQMIDMKDKLTGHMIRVEVPGPEGKAILAKYNQGVPFVKRLFKLCEETAASRGYITTLMGRRCRTNNRRGGTARVALNRLIQGSAADQTKETMRQLYYDHDITPLMTVHDELGFSVSGEPEARRIVSLMEHAVELEVPTVVDGKFGDNWGNVEKLPRAA